MESENTENAAVVSDNKTFSGRKMPWIKLLAVFYGLAVIACIFIIAKESKERNSVFSGTMDKEQVGKNLLGKKANGIGWIYIHGPIYQSSEGGPWERGGYQQWLKKIKAMGDKKDIKAVVLDINSPGGSVAAVQELYSEIIRLRVEKKKPVVALFGDVAASGGYYIASACDAIVAHPGTLTGSIGVIFNTSNIEGLFKKLGITSEAIKSGKHKDIGSMTRQMTPEERKILQNIIDDSYSQFLAAVSEGRKMTVDAVRPLADGRVFSGRQALNAGLIDKLGGAREAADMAGELGGIGKNPKIMYETDKLDVILSAIDMKLSGIFSSGTSMALSGLHGPRLEYMWAY